jgi:hypothetical protein
LKDDSLDEILSEIYSEPIFPPEDLILRTKQSLKRPGLLEYAVTASIALNIIGTFIFAYMLLIAHNTIEKIALYGAVSFIQNIVILITWLYRDKLKELFTRMETTTL